MEVRENSVFTDPLSKSLDPMTSNPVQRTSWANERIEKDEKENFLFLLGVTAILALYIIGFVIFSANTHGEDLGDLALTIPLHKTRVEIERSVCDYDGDIRREEDDTGNRSGFSPVSNISLEIVEGQSPSLPHMEK